MDYELLLQDRINIIRDVLSDKQDKCYIAFSGGKDSTVLSHMIDLAIPNNKIPRVYVNTGVEFGSMIRYVTSLANNDSRIIIIRPHTPVLKVLKVYGYPVKSKKFGQVYARFQKYGFIVHSDNNYVSTLPIKYIDTFFDNPIPFSVSSLCCDMLKKEPPKSWALANNKSIIITGIRKSEGGVRSYLKGCIFKDEKGDVKSFHPLLVCDDDFVNEYIKRNSINLCELYYPPFNLKRTGCKGCPFSCNLKQELDVLYTYFPYEYGAVNLLFGNVYNFYKSIDYML